MTDRLLSICILTYNRSFFIKRLLDKLIPQVSKFSDEVEICISNNHSTDDTRDIIMKFKKEHDDLINYNENEKNIGFDRNLLKAISMAKGNFVWLFGDDDLLIDDGVEKVLEFVKTYGKEDVGLLVLRTESYMVDERTGKRMVYVERPFDEKSRVIELKNENIKFPHFPYSTYLTVQIFNNALLKKIIKDEEDIIQKGLGLAFIHMILYRLMFLRIPNLKSYFLNEVIILHGWQQFKFAVEDQFLLASSRIKIENLLMSSQPPNSNFGPFKEHLMNIKVQFILEMFYMKCFDFFNYQSYFGCIKEFFKKLSITEALMLTTAFIAISVTPPSLAKRILIQGLKMRLKTSWKAKYRNLDILYNKVSKGHQRRNLS